MKRVALLAAVLFATSASAQLLTTLTTTSYTPATYTATAGASLLLQCPGQIVKFVQGSAASPPVASATSLEVNFVRFPLGFPIYLDAANDRISVINGVARAGFTCRIFAGSPAPNTSSSADVVLYVDPIGSDSNACTASGLNACLTIQGAVNKPPKALRHRLTVNLAAGNYAGFVVSGFTTDPSVQKTTGGILIDGVLANVVPTTGSATGTATSGTAGSGTTFGTLTDTAATWTVNDFRGRLITITGGLGSGQVKIITANTATVITVAGTWTAPTGTSTYAIQSPSSIITSTVPLIPTALGVQQIGAAGIQIVNNSTASGITIRNIGIAVGTGGSLAFSGPQIVNLSQVVSTGTGIGVFANNSVENIFSSSFLSTMSASGAGTSLALIDSYMNVAASGPSGPLGAIAGSAFATVSSVRNQLIIASVNSAAVRTSAGGIASLTQSRCDCNSASTSACLSVASGTSVTSPATYSSAQVITGMDVTNCTYGVAVGGTGTVGFGQTNTFSGNALSNAAFVSLGGSLWLPSAITITSGTADLNIDNGTSTASFGSLAAIYSCLASTATGSRICRL
jgi:hypothetical protein